jgi:hypothetical protein
MASNDTRHMDLPEPDAERISRQRTPPARFCSESDGSWEHYPNTVLCFETLGFEIDLRNEINVMAAEWLAKVMSGGPFCVITPDNAMGRRETAEANRESRSRLLAVMDHLAIARTACHGRSPDSAHQECGWAMEVPRDVAAFIASRFGQSAFFYYDGSGFWLEPALVRAERRALPLSGGNL